MNTISERFLSSDCPTLAGEYLSRRLYHRLERIIRPLASFGRSHTMPDSPAAAAYLVVRVSAFVARLLPVQPPIDREQVGLRQSPPQLEAVHQGPGVSNHDTH